MGYEHVYLRSVGDTLPNGCDVIYASHILEHIYDLNATMIAIRNALHDKGILIIDVPDATRLFMHWKAPILDFTTKHLNHFTLRNLLEMGYQYGFESIKVIQYYQEGGMPSMQVVFGIMDVAQASFLHIDNRTTEIIDKLKNIDFPVNIWGLSDLTWYILSKVDINVLDYIDNDPAYRYSTYNGRKVLEKPSNDAPIVILAQVQKTRLIENIRKLGLANEIFVF